MKNIIQIILGLLFFLPLSKIQGQDTLFITNGQKIIVEINNIDAKKVRFKYFSNQKFSPTKIMKLAYIEDIGWFDSNSDLKKEYENWVKTSSKIKIYNRSNIDHNEVIKNRHPNRYSNIYMELGGMSLTGALNIDTRFKNQIDGFGAAIGIGYTFINNENHFSIPIQINYLRAIQNSPKLFMDYSIGYTIHNYNAFNRIFEFPGGIQFKVVDYIRNNEKLNGYAIATIGFRHIPLEKNGLFLKVTNSFIVSDKGIYFVFPSLALGISISYNEK